MDDEVKERPKVGDRVKFRASGATRIGTVVSVAETSVHFLIRWDSESRLLKKRLSDIVRILPEVS